MYVMFFHFFIFVGYSQLNSTTVLDFFFVPGLYDTIICSIWAQGTLFRYDSNFCAIPAILYPRNITTDILE